METKSVKTCSLTLVLDLNHHLGLVVPYSIIHWEVTSLILQCCPTAQVS